MDDSIYQFHIWKDKLAEFPEYEQELKQMSDNPEIIKDCFYKDLKFGTGGIRGKMGLGSNRLNPFVIARTTQGLVNQLKSAGDLKTKKVVIGYDSRNNSKKFCEVTAKILLENDIQPVIFNKPVPTPLVSFITNHINADAGIVITASHNPSIYNGYKVYNRSGMQATDKITTLIDSEINKLDYFDFNNILQKQVDLNPFKIDTDLENEYLRKLLDSGFADENKKDLKILYTPLHGTGGNFIPKTLSSAGFENIFLVEEQCIIDGDFPYCPNPNPENDDSFSLALKKAKQLQPDIILATDPDSDRIRCAVKNTDNSYVLLSGNEIGVLLLDYLIKNSKEDLSGKIVFKTIVTTNVIDELAKHNDIQVVNVLNGFKYIGEQVVQLEKTNSVGKFLIGIEENYGYLIGSLAKDKDAVVSALVICEMIQSFKNKNIDILKYLRDLYRKFGNWTNSVFTFKFEGLNGKIKMNYIMNEFRNNRIISASDELNLEIIDYQEGIKNLPKSNIVEYKIADNMQIIIRPSGTEPILKLYVALKEEGEILLEDNPILSPIIDYIKKFQSDN